MSAQPDPFRPTTALLRATERASGSSAVPGNAVRLLFDGPSIYPVMHELIAEATGRIHFENYIFRDDATGRAFGEQLIAKARAGVRVRVLYDWLGSLGTSRRFWQRLREAGAEVRAFNPPNLRAPFGLISRDHRKTLIVDGARAVTGGNCIGDEWSGDPATGRQPWRDTAVGLDGPAARVLDTSFVAAWKAAGGGAVEDDEVPAEVPQAGEDGVLVVATRPGEERTWRVIDLMLGISNERIWVTEAYLAGPPRLYQVFADAAADGVDVRLLVPGASDIPMVRNFSRTGYRRLLRSGVRLWEWGGPMLHAKTISVDGRWVRVGSSNLNPSSLIANWEVDLFVDSPALAQRLDGQFVEDLARSREVVARLRRVPRLPGFRQPSALIANAPALDRLPDPHRPGMLERRRRAYLRMASLTRAAQAALTGSLGLALVIFALVLAFFPRATAYTTAALAGIAGVALLIGSVHRRRRG